MSVTKRIYLDTSIFIKENYLEGSRLKEIFRLAAEGHLEIVISVITINEIKSNFKRNARAAIEKHNQLMNDPSLRLLRNIPAQQTKLEKFPNLKTITQEFDTLLENELGKANATIIGYPIINIGPIFEKYFAGEFPFNKGDKKHEFPDAFAVMTLEEWCKEHRKLCILFSKDRDLLQTKSRYLKIESAYEDYLERILKRMEPERLAIVPMLFDKNSSFINTEIQAWLRNQLDDDSKYYYFTNSMDVHNLEIPVIDIVDKKYQVTKVDEEYIEVEIIATVQIEIKLEIDDEENSYYDHEEKEVHYMGTTTQKIEQEIEFPLVAHFFIESKDEYDEKCEIIEYNNNEKKFALEPDPWYE